MKTIKSIAKEQFAKEQIQSLMDKFGTRLSKETYNNELRYMTGDYSRSLPEEFFPPYDKTPIVNEQSNQGAISADQFLLQQQNQDKSRLKRQTGTEGNLQHTNEERKV